MVDPLAEVRKSSAAVVAAATSVHINFEKINQEISQHLNVYSVSSLPCSWAQDIHFVDVADPALTAQVHILLAVEFKIHLLSRCLPASFFFIVLCAFWFCLFAFLLSVHSCA